MRRAPIPQAIFKVASSPAVVFLVALVARLWVLSQLLPANAWRYFYQYNEPAHIAWSVRSGYGYSSPWANTLVMPTAQQPPVYPYLLVAIFKLAGTYSYRSLWIAVGMNAFCSALTAIVILKIGKRTFGASTGVLAAWIWSCWIYEAVVSIRLWESSLSALLLAVALLLLPDMAASIRPRRWLIFGALAGVGALTNTTLLSVFPFFWLWLWISDRRRGLSCKKWLAASVLTCVLVILPWTIRNYVTFHRLMPIRDNFGLELWIGNHEGVAHEYPSDFPLLNPAEYNRLGELEFMETKRRIAMQFIEQHPGEFLRLSLRRGFLFWTAPRNSAWPWISLLAWMGLILALRRKALHAAPYAIVMLMFPLVYYIAHTYDTYRHPIESAILLLASYAAVTVAESLLKRIPRHGFCRAHGGSATVFWISTLSYTQW
jgi:4-amino-4-deoxy-L-arabinose transferase-like glycosyltransferase